ncbi:tRNA N6-adenosine threonylcarbamoyltransferase, mitochondrial [Erysiphe neolycopersici]|uniref:N(6)-L-threonylcarbamoyladenine synthase n=1 Tax=Erysiphe neolycopersici TaxID=212602 RepID=A0A420HV37_9PEZI|nr:tRNA N6-adenosine threonylcarbamoyltransferase, mitochondrial [Erysiphe neolycopersici]
MLIDGCYIQYVKHFCLSLNSLGWFNRTEKRSLTLIWSVKEKERVEWMENFTSRCTTWTTTTLNRPFKYQNSFMTRNMLRRFSAQCGKLRDKNSFLQRQNRLTIAIETSCDDTSVAVLEKHANNSATLHFHSKITSDNRAYGGIHPLAAHESHQKNLTRLLNLALERLPKPDEEASQSHEILQNTLILGNRLVRKPHFVTVTRGPGMRASLITGIDTAKGLAVGLQVPLLGVNHMQAHALTPRLISAINGSVSDNSCIEIGPKFPFLSLLISGGHTMLVLSRSILDYTILANTNDLALGDMLDKSARAILPTLYSSQFSNVMYGRALEEFTFPRAAERHKYTPPKASPIARGDSDQGYNWKITPPYVCPGPEGMAKYANQFSFSGIGSKARSIMEKSPNMLDGERRCLAKCVMTVAFEHIGSRVLFALQREELSDIKTLVVSGGVASNQLLRTILRALLDTRGFPHVELVIPAPELCTDNAAMIAWTGIEMFEAGFSTDLSVTALKQWSIDPKSDDGGILGVKGWIQSDKNQKRRSDYMLGYIPAMALE